jgi:hypothetical protein
MTNLSAQIDLSTAQVGNCGEKLVTVQVQESEEAHGKVQLHRWRLYFPNRRR